MNDDLLPEYDFTGAVRGKYYQRYRQGTNVILLDPDVAEVFRDAKTVNDALRLLVSVAEARVPQLRPDKRLQPTKVTGRIRSRRRSKSSP